MNTVNLDAESKRLHDNAVNKGFWEPNNEDTHTIFYLKQIAMIHSECSEVLEAIRKEKGDNQVVEELAGNTTHSHATYIIKAVSKRELVLE